MQEHSLKNFDNELEKLRGRLVKMGSLVCEQTKYLVQSLQTGDKECLKNVKIAEEKIDALDLKIDKQCMRIFALHQPVASDLRFVMSAISLNDNLEIIGDAAVAAAYLLERTELSPLSIKKTKILYFGQLLEKMLNEAIEAIINADSVTVNLIIDMKNTIIETTKENYFKTVGMMNADANYMESGACILDLNRGFATIAMQTISLAQKIVFIIDGRMVRHQNSLIATEEAPE